MDISVTVKTEKILTNLVDKVKCVKCSNILISPFQATCHHIACARCFSLEHNKCPLCSASVNEFDLRPNQPLSRRTAAVLRVVKSYEAFIGKTVLPSQSISDDKDFDNSNREDTVNWLSKDDKKFTKTYGKKKNDELCSQLLSVSQNDTPLIFPGEVIDIPQNAGARNVDKNPSAIDKVQEWLGVSQVNKDGTGFGGSRNKLYPDNAYEDFFKKNLENVYNTKDKLYNKSPRPSLNTTPSPDTPSDKATRSKRPSRISPNKSNEKKNISSGSTTEIPNTSPKRLNRKANASSALKCNYRKTLGNKNVSKIEVDTHKDQSNANKVDSSKITDLCDSDASNNCSFKANDSELKNIFSKILRNNKEKQNIENDEAIRPKDKNSWRNFRKMKKVLNRPTRGAPTKLNISVAERNIPFLDKDGVHTESETPISIEDIVTQNDEMYATPEAVRKCPSVTSKTSTSLDHLDSPECQIVDKDYLACEAAKLASTKKEINYSSPVPDESITFEPPLTHLSPCDKNDVSKVGNIIKKIEGEMVISNILKDFEVECQEHDDTDQNMDDGSFVESAGLDSISRHADNDKCASVSNVPFVLRGCLGDTSLRQKGARVPLDSKSSMSDWYRISQNGVNIEICKGNSVTSIYIRNQQLSIDPQLENSSLKIVETRDAQVNTDPFPPYSDGNNVMNQANVVGAIGRSSDLPQTNIDYKIHPSLQRFTNILVPSMCGGDTNMRQCIPDVGIYNPGTSTDSLQHNQLDKTLVGKQNPPVLHDTETLSPPLIVTEPLPDTLFDCSKKRKLPQSFNPMKYYSKRSKIEAGPSQIMTQNVNVIFDTQLQELHRESKGDGESLNCDTIMNSVMANIDKDLGIMAGQPVSKLAKSANIGSIISPEVIDLCDDIIPSNNSNHSFMPTQRKTIEDETDLRIVSMEMDGELASKQESQVFIQNTLIENDENLKNQMTASKSQEKDDENDDKFNTLIGAHEQQHTEQEYSQVRDVENTYGSMFDKNTIGFSEDSGDRRNAQIFSSLNLPQSIQQLKNENMSSQDISKHGERTVQLLPHEELLLTPSMRVGKSLSDSLSQNLCTPVNEEDSDASIVEDTPQKSRKFTIIKKSVHETSKSKQSLAKIHENEKENNAVNQMDVLNIGKKSDTPVSISKFTDHVKVCSTPVVVCARRSLSYKENMSTISEDEGVSSQINETQFMRQSVSHTPSCMEKEFLEQAFESSMNKSLGKNSTILESNKVAVTKPQGTCSGKNISVKSKVVPDNVETNVCIACSCLVKDQIAKVKALCKKMNWKFTNDYSDQLTHLIVKIDEDNRSQRSIKYVQALAAGKWIVSFHWIEKCIETNSLAPECDYEVFDSSGERGPFISRTRTSKLFAGFTFYCCPPFSTITLEVLAGILKAAGGDVVERIEDIIVTDLQKVSILLAEPAYTEDDRFLDMAVKKRVVPINFDWAIECLGEGVLCNAGSHILAPGSLLPPVKWPINLITDESMEALAN